jgi:hypothetical protein
MKIKKKLEKKLNNEPAGKTRRFPLFTIRYSLFTILCSLLKTV